MLDHFRVHVEAILNIAQLSFLQSTLDSIQWERERDIRHVVLIQGDKTITSVAEEAGVANWGIESNSMLAAQVMLHLEERVERLFSALSRKHCR